MRKDREQSMDAIKGVLITLVVIFHANLSGSSAQPALQNFNDLTFSFLMPMFCLVSGYFAPFRRLDAGRFIRVAVPYVVFLSLYIFGLHLAARLGLGTTNRPPAADPLNLLRAIILTSAGPYWYLHVLIFYVAAVDVVVRVSERFGSVLSMATGLGLCILAALLGLRMYALLFFALGTALRILPRPAPPLYAAILGLGFMLMATVVWSWTEVIVRGSLASAGWTLGCALLLYAICQCLDRVKALTPLSYLGRNSLFIFLFHPLAMQVSNLAGRKAAEFVAPALVIAGAAGLNIALSLSAAALLKFTKPGRVILGLEAPVRLRTATSSA